MLLWYSWDRCYDFWNIFAKNFGENIGILTQNKAKLCKILIITLVFEKTANFFAENWQKSQKIVIITSTPGLTLDKDIDLNSLCQMNVGISKFGAFLYSRQLRHEIDSNELAALHDEIVRHNRMSQHDEILQRPKKRVRTMTLQCKTSKIPYLYYNMHVTWIPHQL
jgi:hypothetical protein